MRRLFSFTNLVGLVVLALGGLGLWATQGNAGTRQLNLPSQLDPVGPRTLRLHFAKDSGDGLTVEERVVQIGEGEDVLARALSELLKGPQAQGAAAIAPAGTPVPTVFLRDDVAIVDLPAAYNRLNFGTAAETHLIYGIALTLLEFKEVQAVKFMLEGKDIESLGHLSLIDPFKRP